MNIVEFEADFEARKRGSELIFGNIVIDTDPPYDEEEDELEEYAYQTVDPAVCVYVYRG